MIYRELPKYKYELLKTEAVETTITGYDIDTPYIALWPNGRLFVFGHYAWDGPSGPTIDTPAFMRGSLVHDALYQLIREGWIDKKHRKDADELLRQICIEDGMCKVRAWYVYRGVRMFAGKAAEQKNGRGRVVELKGAPMRKTYILV